MDKLSKLNMFYNLADAQGIWCIFNIGTYSLATTPLVTIAPSPTPAIEAPTSVCDVDQLGDYTTTLLVGESA